MPPGTSDNLNCYFMPEFLTEKNFERDFIENKDWIFGLKNTDQDIEFMEKINYLIIHVNMSKLFKILNIYI